ncbi:MAG: MerR family transcriptional regulator [Firmicutes bacterium]|nr:MerR family transcriptional regulator [Bacillota bacterium]
MELRIGHVAKLFDVREETLRYYEKEGFLSPGKNPENGYRQYTMSDILMLTDLLFYRDIGIPIADIHRILDGMAPEEVTALIHEKKSDVDHQIRRLQQSRIKLDRWEEFHQQSLSHMDRFDIRPMPAVLIHKKAMIKPVAGYSRRQFVPWPKELSFFATFSFYCNVTADPVTVSRYVVLDQSLAEDLDFNPKAGEYMEESADRCLFTVVKYDDDWNVMLAPLIQYAKDHDLTLAGPVYGRQSINDYSTGDMHEYYRVYAVLGNDK